MRKALLLVILLWAAPAFATNPAFVTGQKAHLSAGTGCYDSSWTTTCVLPALSGSTTVDDTLLMMVSYCTQNTCAESHDFNVTAATAQGDNFTICKDFTPGSSTLKFAIYYAKVTSAGTAVTTLTSTGSNALWYARAVVFEASNIKLSSPCDSTPSSSVGGSGTSMSLTLGAATAECNEVALVVGQTVSGTVTFTGGSANIDSTGLLYVGWNLIPTVSTPTLTATESVNEAWAMYGVTFKAISGGCGTVARRSFGSPRTGTRQVR